MLQNLLSRVVEIVTSEMPAAKGKKSRRGKKAHLRHRSLQFESLENRELLTVTPFFQRDYDTPQIVVIDYDGEKGVVFDGPEQLDFTVAPFELPLPGVDVAEYLSEICADLNTLFNGWNVEFVLTPPSEGDYSTIYLGGSNDTFLVYGDFLGLAESVDVGNLNPNDKAFIFSETIAARTDVAALRERLTTIIAHETGHLIGLSHSSDALGGIMAGGHADSVHSEWEEVGITGDGTNKLVTNTQLINGIPISVYAANMGGVWGGLSSKFRGIDTLAV